MSKLTHRCFFLPVWPIAGLLLLIASSVQAADPGKPIPDTALISDQKPGSVLVYNFHNSTFANGAVSGDVEINLINTHPTTAVSVRLFLINGSTGAVKTEVLCIGPNQPLSFLASQLDPGVTGYIVAVAIDGATGCPISHNFLMGDAYLKLATGYFGKLNAMAIAANFPGRLASCNAGAATATLPFDAGASGYNRLPRALALDHIPSLGDGNSTLLILNRLSGNLATGLSPLGPITGKLYNGAGTEFGFSSLLNTPQLSLPLSSSFPQSTSPLSTIIPAGGSGWLKLWTDSEVGILGAAFNYNTNLGAQANAYAGGQNLRQLTLAENSNLIIPVSPQNCANRPLLLSLSPGVARLGSQPLTLTVGGSGFVNGAMVRWNGAGRATSYLSSTKLTASITAADLAAGGNAEITVANPSSGAISNSLRFAVLCAYSLSAASQSFSAAGGTGSVNVVTGAGCPWTATSNVNWITIPSGASSSGNGVINFSVAPNSGAARTGILSIADKTFTITQAATTSTPNPVPALALLNPGTAAAGGSDFPLILTGTGFVDLSVVRWNGVNKPITFVSSTQLRATISRTDIASAGVASVTVFNPPAGGGISNALNFTITQNAQPLLYLSFNDTLTGAEGETPTQAVGINFRPGVAASGVSLPSGNRLSYPSAGNINATEGTVSLWIKPAWNGADGQDRAILSYGGNGGILIEKDGANNLRIILNRFVSEVTTSSNVGDWKANEWHHLAFTWSNSKRTAKHYIDGTPRSSAPFSFNLPAINATTFQIGSDDGAWPLDAVIDEMRISGVDHSTEEIAQHFLTLPEQEPNEISTQATPIGLPSIRTGSVAVGDLAGIEIIYNDGTKDQIEDLFAITLDQTTRFGLVLSPGNSSADLDLFLIRETSGGLTILEASTTDSGSEQLITRTPLAAGRYLIGVSAFSGSAGYTLTSKNLDVPSMTQVIAIFRRTGFPAEPQGKASSIRGVYVMPRSSNGTNARLRLQPGSRHKHKH